MLHFSVGEVGGLFLRWGGFIFNGGGAPHGEGISFDGGIEKIVG